ncbi:MAG: LysR family transcriptional regulator [Acidobacteriota bacterium]|nr:LysR family transcriptional regulator [Acidobacteriota bacterium]
MLENFRLKVFRAVAEHRNFRKAGEALYLTQPAVTLQIKTLEKELNTKLFERTATGVHMTESGRTLLGYAERLHDLAEEAEASLAALKGEMTGELALGASTTIAQYVLPALLAEFSRLHPAIQLQVFSENTEHIAEGVAAGRFGLGLIEGPPMRRDLKVERWFDDELVLVVPASHEWANRPSISARKLAGVPFVLRERGSGTRSVVEQGLKKAGVRLGDLHIVMELDSIEAILSCIEAGLGIGFVSEWAMLRRRSGTLATLRLTERAIRRNFSLVSPEGPALPAPAAAMHRFLRSRIPPRPVVR